MDFCLTFPPEWMRTHLNYIETIPKPAEIVSSTTLVKQFNAVEDWLSRNWTGVAINFKIYPLALKISPYRQLTH
jgi:hypothetical protein